MGLTRKLGEFVSSLRYEDLPPEVISEVKFCVLDWFGVTLSGSKEPLVDILLQVLRAEGGNPLASVIGRSEKVSLQQAALVNGSASHALDFDDVNTHMMGHPTVVVLPAPLALGELKRCSGKDFITAFVAGFETVCHIGLCQTRKHGARGWHPTATLGHFGAAAACANLLHLDLDKTITSFGIAGTQAAGLRTSFGTMCKPLHAGKASMNGLLAAQLAEKGFTASQAILEEEEGFTHTFTPDGNLTYEPEGLGRRYEILDVKFKRYASCFGTHPSIDVALALREEGLKPDDIESVHAIPFHGLYDAISIMKPSTSLEGKFSLPYTFAAAFVQGRVGEEEFGEESLKNPEIIKIRDKVTMEKDEKIPVNTSHVVVKTRDGRTIERNADVNQVFKDVKKKEESLRNKFFGCATKVLSERQSEDLYAGIMQLEKIGDLGSLINHSVKKGAGNG